MKKKSEPDELTKTAVGLKLAYAAYIDANMAYNRLLSQSLGTNYIIKWEMKK